MAGSLGKKGARKNAEIVPILPLNEDIYAHGVDAPTELSRSGCGSRRRRVEALHRERHVVGGGLPQRVGLPAWLALAFGEGAVEAGVIGETKIPDRRVVGTQILAQLG